MKTQEAAQYDFWSQFGIPAYPNTAVPKDPVLPYLTYQAVNGYWEDVSNVTLQLWMWTESESAINAKATEIGNAIGYGGVTLQCDNGIMRITRGNPWVVPANAQDENTLKLRQMNVRIEFLITR